MNVNKNIWFKVLFLTAVFFLAIGVWYSPIVFKGYPTQIVSEEIVLARNYHKTGVLASQNDMSVTISSDLIREQGHPLVMSQYLRSFFYAKIFDYFGVPNYNTLVLISIILYALALVLFTILVLYLFNFKIAVVFSLIYIFIPFGWGLTLGIIGVYEFCLFFWALFFIFYFWGLKKNEPGQKKYAIPLFIISGIFLILSGLSKETTFVFALALFIFLLSKKFKQQLICIFVPFSCLLIIFWLPSVLSGQNRYLSLFSGRATKESIFSHYLHVFPDPYTYYFEKEEFLEKFKNQDLGLLENLETKKSLANYGIGKIGIIDRFKVGNFILSKHLSRFVSLEEFGGPLITLLLILGFRYLKDKSKYIFSLSKYWLGISFLVFSYVVLVSRSHLMDFIWLFVLLVTLGWFYLIEIVKNFFRLARKKAIIFEIVIISLVLYHLVLIDHVVLGEQYDKDFMPRSLAYAGEIKKMKIQDREVIAIPDNFPNQDNTLNYLTGKSFVIFRDSTLNKLLKEKKIKQAFETFGVKYILDYPDKLSDQIVAQTNVTNIASQSMPIEIPRVSANKSFLLNLIR